MVRKALERRQALADEATLCRQGAAAAMPVVTTLQLLTHGLFRWVETAGSAAGIAASSSSSATSNTHNTGNSGQHHHHGHGGSGSLISQFMQQYQAAGATPATAPATVSARA